MEQDGAVAPGVTPYNVKGRGPMSPWRRNLIGADDVLGDLTVRAFGLALAGFTLVVPGVGALLLGLLIGFMIVMQSLEIWTSKRLPPRPGEGAFDMDRAVMRKVMRWAVVAVAGLIDAVVYTVAVYLPHSFKLIERGLPFFLATSLAWYIIADLVQFFANVRQQDNEDLPVPLTAFVVAARELVKTIRFVNVTRWAQSGNAGKLPERYGDQLTADEYVNLLLRVKTTGEVPEDPINAVRGPGAPPGPDLDALVELLQGRFTTIGPETPLPDPEPGGES